MKPRQEGRSSVQGAATSHDTEAMDEAGAIVREPSPPPPVAPDVPARKGPPKPLLVVLALAAIGGTAWWLYARNFEETDDAQIDGDIASISARVPGTIKAVHVVENQRVNAGDVLAEIDEADFEVAILQAKAQVAQAEAMLEAENPNVPAAATTNEANVKGAAFDRASAEAALSSAKQEEAQLAAQLAQGKANDRNAQIELRRTKALFAERAVTQAELDRRDNAAAATAANVAAIEAALAAARDHIAQQEARLDASNTRLSEVKQNAPRTLAVRRASVVARQAALDLARAQEKQAELNLSYTKVTAPAAGIVGKKSVSVGDRVAPGQQLMALSELESLWVTANFRETQLERMQPGQPVDVHVDAIDKDLHGTVESVGGATGSRYSILPPENASGNYVKVVQRIPVRVKIEGDRDVIARLRPGMSAEPKVRVR